MAYLGSIIGNGGTGIAGNPLIGSGGGGGSGTVTNIGTDATLTGGPISTTGTLGLALGNANTWTAAQTFSGGITGTLTGSASANVLRAGDSMTGALNNTGVFNTTSAAGFQQGGVTILNTTGSVNGSTLVGVSAGALLAAGTQGVTAIGWGAMASNTFALTSICENTVIGYLAGNSLVSTSVNGQFNTFIGAGAGWNEVNTSSNVCVGGDAMRDTVGSSNCTGIGFRANQNGAMLGSVAAGAFALVGNSSFIQLSGTPTTGDTISITLTSTQIAGGFATTAPYTVLVSDTLATITTALIAAVQTLNVLGNGSANPAYNNTTGIYFVFPGTSATGWSLTLTSTVTGAATEVLTPSTGSVGSYNIGIGFRALSGNQMSSAFQNIAIGNGAGSLLTTGHDNFLGGFQAGSSLTSGGTNVFICNSSGLLATTAQGCIGIGLDTLGAVTTITGAVAIGNAAGRFTTAVQTLIGNNAGTNLTTGAGNSGVGQNVLQGATNSTAGLNCGFGVNTLDVVSSAQGNCAYGYSVGGGVTSGSYNTLMGYQCWASGLTTGTGNIAISAGNATIYNPANASNTFYLGTNGVPLMSGTSLQTAGSAALAVPNGLLTLGTASTFGASLVLQGATSGAVTVTVPAVAGATAVTLTHGGSGQTNVSAPTAPASTAAFAMQGLAGSITPASSGTILIMISGTIVDPSGTAAGNGIQYQLSYGTGSAPANAAALTGTQVGTVQKFTSPTTVIAADVNQPFTTQAVVTGLTKGTAYWLDLAAESIATISSMGLTNVSVSAIELL